MTDGTPAAPVANEKMEEAALWCIQLSEGSLDEDEWAEFETWLAKPGHAALFQDAIAVWQASGAIGDRPRIISLRTEALTEFRNASRRRWLTASRRMWWPLGYAAALLLSLGTGAYWYVNQPSRYETGIGERQVAMLDDGSRVSIDAVTAMTVRMKDEARQVELVEGRAKFDVAKDPLRPFTVAAGDKLIAAVGTSFSVEMIDGEVRVILYEGQVEIRDRSDSARSAAAASQRLLMTPGSEFIGTAGSTKAAQITRPDLSQSLSWEQGLINFDQEPLARAVERMNRYATKRIVLADPGIGGIAVDGVYKAGDVDAFVEGIVALHPVRQRRGNGEIILDRK
ncbi:DUF4880 domain-containing protein [Sphingomonas koreensis]|uniref:DUF4880 domain-containing protein n=1 Tax=Sphingomonas koreensis TaxID=93064 RepID=A0A430G8F7_9SPHN|nr:FecR domain-containing protein [Sphingomonas koreensis]RSY90431.1 DUF4880 domain-containing protein [Sphingomonas koreensis]